MLSRKISKSIILSLALSALLCLGQDQTTGSIKGKVGVEGRSTPEGVTVIVQQGEREVKRVETDRKGEFVVPHLAAGMYEITLRKSGLNVVTLEKIEVRAGKTRSLPERLFMAVDPGSLAILRGSVFNEAGRSVRGARVELALIRPDGSTRKLDGRISNETGFFVFRLLPERARYLITVKADGLETKTQEVEVEGAARTNIAINLKRPATN